VSARVRHFHIISGLAPSGQSRQTFVPESLPTPWPRGRPGSIPAMSAGLARTGPFSFRRVLSRSSGSAGVVNTQLRLSDSSSGFCNKNERASLRSGSFSIFSCLFCCCPADRTCPLHRLNRPADGCAADGLCRRFAYFLPQSIRCLPFGLPRLRRTQLRDAPPAAKKQRGRGDRPLNHPQESVDNIIEIPSDSRRPLHPV
jgi:hypothetical protein